MWMITRLELPDGVQAWASDGAAVAGVLRGGWGVTTRLIVSGLGFLDVVDGVAGLFPRPVVANFNEVELSYRDQVAQVALRISQDGTFVVAHEPQHPSRLEHTHGPGPSAWHAQGLDHAPPELGPSQVPAHPLHPPHQPGAAHGHLHEQLPGHEHAYGHGHAHEGCAHCGHAGAPGTGRLKPLPTLAEPDLAEVSALVDQGLLPYRQVPAAPGQTAAQLAALGAQLFPCYPAGAVALATAAYDATTPSFARLALCDHLAYCGAGAAPHPLDVATLAQAIWRSSSGTSRPEDAAFLGSFGLAPAHHEAEVRAQLERVLPELQRRHAAQLRVLTAALAAMPRTSVLQVPQLYGSQVEPYPLGLEHFASGFAEYAGNAGPVGAPLAQPLPEAIAGFLKLGATVTNKMLWRFRGSMPEAMTYQHGILLILSPPPDVSVWDAATCVTPLSSDPNKLEWLIAPGARFAIRSVATYPMLGQPVTMLSLQLLT